MPVNRTLEESDIDTDDLPRLAPQFEYLVEHLTIGVDGYRGLAEILGRFSATGWRLIAVYEGLHYFEREL